MHAGLGQKPMGNHEIGTCSWLCACSYLGNRYSGMFLTIARILSVGCEWTQGSVCLPIGFGLDTS